MHLMHASLKKREIGNELAEKNQKKITPEGMIFMRRPLALLAGLEAT